MARIKIKDLSIALDWIILIITALIFSCISFACAEKKTYVKKDKVTEITEETAAIEEDKKTIEDEDYNKTQEYWFELGISYSNEGKHKEAKEAFKKAIKISPDFAEAHYRLGLEYKELGDIQYSIRALNQAIKINPGFAEAHFSLGLIYKGLGRDNLALEAFKNAVRINPDNASAHNFLGEIYLALRLKKEAKEAFMKATKIKPDFAEAHYNLGSVYVMFDDIGSALEEYKILIDLDRRLAYRLFNQIYK